jgi:pectate lyase
MKNKTKLFKRVAVISVVLCVVCLFNSCVKKLDDPAPSETQKRSPVELKPGLFAVDFDGLRSDGGFAYKIGYVLAGGDSDDQPIISNLRLFENGVELHPAHSQHADIRNLGGGRFSHWETTLYFSTSDNTNPVTNGREYAYTLDGSAYPTSITVKAVTNGTGSHSGQ